MKLENKIAVITGAGKGIGKYTAELFLKEGASVVLNSRSARDLNSFAKENSSYKHKIVTVAGDISKEMVIRKVIRKTINTFKRIDILVNDGPGIHENGFNS